MEFQVGDIVTVNKKCNLKNLETSCAKVVAIDRPGIGIDFHKVMPGCHDLNGLLAGETGLWMSPDHLIKLEPASEVVNKLFSRQ